jgi:hypothetical protein
MLKILRKNWGTHAEVGLGQRPFKISFINSINISPVSLSAGWFLGIKVPQDNDPRLLVWYAHTAREQITKLFNYRKANYLENRLPLKT